MLATILSWLGGPLATALTAAYKAKLAATTSEQSLVADAVIADIKSNSDIIQAGMQHKAFWIPWLIAAVPTAAWFGWGMADSLCNGALPDVASLPPQLKGYADVVFANIFYTGAGAAGIQAIAAAIRGRK